MALSPNIPTSFVPHPTTGVPRQFRTRVVGVFPLLCYIVLGFVVIVSILIFFYGRLLASEQASEDASLAKAEAGIDPTTVEQFIRLRNRLAEGQTLLNSHVALSNFFAVLEKALPATVRFTTLHVSVNDTGTALLDGAGVAKSFNALAAASDAFDKDGRIKDAVFSNISVQNGLVSFELTATIDPKLLAYTPSSYAAIVPAPQATMATTSATTTTP